MAMTYQEVLRKLGRRVSVQLDKVRGTELRRAPGEAGERGDLEVRYHGQAVVTLHTDQTYTLRIYGHLNKTASVRISEYSPVSLVKRGGAIWMQSPAYPQPIRFFDGMRVDVKGELVGEWVGHATPTVAAVGSGAQMLDEAKLRMFIRRLVREELKSQVAALAPLARRSPGELAAAIAADVTPEAPTKATLRATAAPISPAAFAADNVDFIRNLMQRAGADPAKAERVLKDLAGAVRRGRPTRGTANDEAEDTAEATMLTMGDEQARPSVTPPPPIDKAADLKRAPDIGQIGDCPDCGLSLVAHYDRANRFKGCNYAASHREDLTLV